MHMQMVLCILHPRLRMTLYYCFVLFCMFFLCSQIVVEEAGEIVESLNGVTAVHAQFYDLSSKFHKVCL